MDRSGTNEFDYGHQNSWRNEKAFHHHSLLEQLVSDKGPQFVAEEFRSFMRNKGIKHIRSTPYHPPTNGLAEWFVQTFKQALREQQLKGNPALETGEFHNSL